MKRLTSAELEAIRKRTEAATEGQWRISEFFTDGYIVTEKDGLIAITADTQNDGDTFEGFTDNYDKDAEFIAAARSDVPALLDEIAYLSGVIGALQSDLKEIARIGVTTEQIDVPSAFSNITIIAREGVEYAKEARS